ncbi:head-tail adaptor protein [Hansschlegelia quercus]|uniref:head-tail adaptor protein n=1 Tax=Hansschlegelia quercus TaxID=2528245 RepID=UPI001FE0B1A9|nr:head-tail adaptor protein [Hansschlegelia quercus]
MSGPGALRRRVAIDRPADIEDGVGGFVRGFAALAETFAEVEPVSSDQQEKGRALGLRTLWRVTIRARGDLGGGFRLRWRDQAFAVLSVRPLDSDGRFEELLCEEFSA